MGIRISDPSRQASCDAIVDRIDLGSGTSKIEIRSGAKPATPATAATGTLLSTILLPNPAFGAANSTGTAALLGVPLTDASAAATGTAGWFRVYDRTTPTPNAIFDGDVTATGGGGDLTLATVSIVAASQVVITAGSFSMPMG